MVLSALKIFKNYIARCDFWSCRHFVDRVGYMVIITPKRLPFKDKNESCILQIQKGYDLFVQNVTFLTKK